MNLNIFFESILIPNIQQHFIIFFLSFHIKTKDLNFKK